MNFSGLDLINFNLQDVNFLLIAIDLIEIDIASNRFARFYEARPKQMLCWSKQRFLRPYCTLLWSFDQLLGSGLSFIIFNLLSACYSFGKVGKYLQILFRDGIWLTRVHLVLIKTILRPQSYLIMGWNARFYCCGIVCLLWSFGSKFRDCFYLIAFLA